jgi:hypothetical protein
VKDKIYIADSNNHLIRVCDLKAGRVLTLAFKPIERLARRKERLFAEEVIPLDPIRVSPKARSLTLDIVLPTGTKLNPEGPSRLKARSANTETVDVDFKDELKQTKIVLPIEAKPGQTILTFETDLYYCSKDNEGLCFFKSARWNVPVEVVENGSANPVAEFRVVR